MQFFNNTVLRKRTHLKQAGLPRWAGTRKVKSIWILLEQETVSASGISWAICKSAPRSRQITTPATHHSYKWGFKQAKKEDKRVKRSTVSSYEFGSLKCCQNMCKITARQNINYFLWHTWLWETVGLQPAMSVKMLTASPSAVTAAASCMTMSHVSE